MRPGFPVPAKKNTPSYEPPCRECGGRCCHYVALEIDTPKTKADFDQIRWFLAHKDVCVFTDHNRIWHVEFRSPCEALDGENRCTIYDVRPNICRSYGEEEGMCEYHDNPYALFFTKLPEFEAWLQSRGKEWRFSKW